MDDDGTGLTSTDFALLLGARFFSNVARKMVAVTLAWEVYRISGSALALGLIGLTEAVPFLAVSLWAGHLVDRHHKKPFMAGAEGVLLLCAVILIALTALPPSLLPLYAVMGIMGLGISFGSIASNVYLQMLVPQGSFPRAAAWNLAQFTIATVLGPLLGGWLLSAASARAVYAASAGAFTVSLVLIGRLRFRPARTEMFRKPALQGVREGIRFVRSQPLLLACMSLDMVAVLFGDAVAIFPVFARLLQAGPLGFGVLRASPALGSALVSLAQAARPFIRPSWGWIKKAVLVFGLSMIAFALARDMKTAVFFLVIGGAADGFSVIIRQSVYQARTPDALRGRVAALSGIFISASNEIGAFESGLSAQLIGPVPTVVLGGCVTLASVLFMGWKYRGIEEERGA